MSEEKKERGCKKKLDRIDRMCLYCVFTVPITMQSTAQVTATASLLRR